MCFPNLIISYVHKIGKIHVDRLIGYESPASVCLRFRGLACDKFALDKHHTETFQFQNFGGGGEGIFLAGMVINGCFPG